MGTKLFIGIFVLAVVLVGWTRFAEQNSVSTDASVISANGIHWHPEVKIFIHGEEMDIPANIGLIGGHNPMHTHETDGVIHLEYEGVVREDDIRLGQFFRLWGREFNSNQIFDNVNTDTEKVHMFVNGVENLVFENYLMQPEDKIEIRFE